MSASSPHKRPSGQRLQALRDYYVGDVDGAGDVEDLFAEIDGLEEQLEAVQAEHAEMAMILDSQGWERVRPGQWERQEAGVSSPATMDTDGAPLAKLAGSAKPYPASGVTGGESTRPTRSPEGSDPATQPSGERVATGQPSRTSSTQGASQSPEETPAERRMWRLSDGTDGGEAGGLLWRGLAPGESAPAGWMVEERSPAISPPYPSRHGSSLYDKDADPAKERP